jgi:hypothetical protein
MIFLSIGLPSRFAEWCDQVICALVEAATGRAELASGNTLEEIALALMKSQAPQLVIGARQPTDDLRTLLSQTGRHFVVSLDDPRAAFQNLATRHGLGSKDAIRATAGSCASIFSYEAMPEALVLRAEQEGRNPLEAATAIAHWLNIEINPAEIAALLNDRPDLNSLLLQGERGAWWTTIAATDRAVVDGALNGYIDHFSGGARMGHLVWARDLFFIGDDPYAAADRVIDVAGPVRNLLFGPYMTLPSGLWDATVVLAISKEAASVAYSVEILAGQNCICLGRETIHPHGEGICEATVDFAVRESTDQPISLRLANLSFAINGRLALLHVTVAPRLREHAAIPAEFTVALGW